MSTHPSFLKTLVLTLPLALAACGTPPVPYVPPKDVPLAQIRAAMVLPSSNASISIRPGMEATGRFHPFFLGHGHPEPTAYRELEANQYFALYYDESLPAGQRCEIRAAFVLEAGKQYTLWGGAHFEPSKLWGQIRSCQLHLKDDSTGLEVPMLGR